MEFETCNMLPKSMKDYKDISLDELIKIRSMESKLRKLNNTEDISLEINSQHKINDIVDNAIKQSKIVKLLSQNKIKNIPFNKKIEKLSMRKEEYFDLDPQIQNNDDTIVELDKYTSPPMETDKMTYEQHEQKHKDEMNDLLKSVVFSNKKNK